MYKKTARTLARACARPGHATLAGGHAGMVTSWLAFLSSAICNLMFGEEDEYELESAHDACVPLPTLESPTVNRTVSRAAFTKLTISTMAPVVAATAAIAVSSARRSAPSPCSVEAHPLQSPENSAPDAPAAADRASTSDADTEQTVFLPLVALSFAYMYNEMVSNRHWNVEFHRGRRPSRPPPTGAAAKRARQKPPKMGHTRTLATRHLSAPCVDGWNVIIGALELARVWGLEGGPERLADAVVGEYDLPLWTRMRMACCLTVAFKFQRANYTCYPRRFYDHEDPSLFSPYTEELAHLGFAFFTLEEQSRFGEWSETNQEAIRALYAQMLALEGELVCTVSTFPLLAENVLACTELCLQRLFDRHVRTDEEVMRMRALVPFFLYATMGRTYEALTALKKDTSAGALACVAWFVASTPASGKPLFKHSKTAVRFLFTGLERMWAVKILTAAADPPKVVGQLMMMGAYGDPTFELRPFLTREAVDAALVAAIATA